MNIAGHFEKVTYEQFEKDIKSEFGEKWSDEEIRHFYDGVKKPRRATKGSSGYDFYSPIPLTLEPWEEVKFPTGIRAVINDGWWLCCMPRSGSGFKHFLRLANTIGNIDMDYQFSSNEGHIWAKIRMERGTLGKIIAAFKYVMNSVLSMWMSNPNFDEHFEVKPLEINAGEAFMQSVFLPFGVTDDDEADGVRDGGLGSTAV